MVTDTMTPATTAHDGRSKSHSTETLCSPTAVVQEMIFLSELKLSERKSSPGLGEHIFPLNMLNVRRVSDGTRPLKYLHGVQVKAAVALLLAALRRSRGHQDRADVGEALRSAVWRRMKSSIILSLMQSLAGSMRPISLGAARPRVRIRVDCAKGRWHARRWTRSRHAAAHELAHIEDKVVEHGGRHQDPAVHYR